MAEVCYRHPNRETAVSCSACGRPICPDCMTPTPVGMRCPECSNQRTKVVRGTSTFAENAAIPATFTLMAISIVGYLVEIGAGTNRIINDYGLFGPLVSSEPYRIVTSGFLHGGLLHIAFNMYVLFILGRLLEPALGWPRFVAIYLASLLIGSLGVIVLDPNSLAVGASGAIFGLFAAAFVILHGRGLAAQANQLGFIIVINLIFTFTVPHIAIGAHLFGAAGGALCALFIVAGDRGKLGSSRVPIELTAISALGIAAAVITLAIS